MHDQGLVNPLDKNDKPTKLSLQIGAEFLEIRKKSLDDYYSVIKKALELGFSFNKIDPELKMGFLRKYIRDGA